MKLKAYTEGTLVDGTTYYKTRLNEVKKVLRDSDNIILSYLIDEDGFDAIDWDNNLFGSYIDGDTLYICDTDGYDIIVDDEIVDPYEAFDEYTPDELKDYIRLATVDVIESSITYYELVDFDDDEILQEMMDAGYKYSDIQESLKEIRG